MIQINIVMSLMKHHIIRIIDITINNTRMLININLKMIKNIILKKTIPKNNKNKSKNNMYINIIIFKYLKIKMINNQKFNKIINFQKLNKIKIMKMLVQNFKVNNNNKFLIKYNNKKKINNNKITQINNNNKMINMKKNNNNYKI